MESLRWLFKTFRNIPRYVLRFFAMAFMFIVLLYYPIGMLLMNHIDDDPNFTALTKFDIPGGSHAIAITEALIEREIKTHRWVPNDPFFMPSSMLIRMPAFQHGIIDALSRFGIQLYDHLGRARGSSEKDPDLESAAGLLKYSPDVWIFNLSVSIWPTAPSHDQYRKAEKLLYKYNERLAKGQAIFDRRADNLMDALEGIASDLGSSSAEIDARIHNFAGRFLDPGAAAQFYRIKGQMYAEYLLLRELKRDFADIISEKKLDDAWKNMLASLSQGAQLGHFFIFNGSPNSAFMPNHLAMQGFYLLRARTQLSEVTNILLK